MKILYRYILILFIPVCLNAQHPDSLFVAGQSAYDAGEYQEAIEFYGQIIRQGKESSQLHYNLGNAYFKAEELGEAILHFEKAKKINPRDGDIQHNLSIARVRVQDRINPPDKSLFMQIFDGVKYFLSINELATLVLLIILLMSMAFAARKIINRDQVRRLLGNLLVLLILAFLLLSPMLVARTYEVQKSSRGIILQEQVKVHAAPQQLSTEIFEIHEGTEVVADQQQNDWYHIRLMDGKEGWIPLNSVGII
ncbi:MAG: tetratricopeptide repeat protein [Candidatus Marinimicrobia bacterium]|nr:tetratricopeptide repeat protein [Candidatus Neomarinimicrobiota bacterium]